jgi:hypothetical protein
MIALRVPRPSSHRSHLHHLGVLAGGLFVLLHLLLVHPMHLAGLQAQHAADSRHEHSMRPVIQPMQATVSIVAVNTATHEMACAAPVWIINRLQVLLDILPVAIAAVLVSVLLNAGWPQLLRFEVPIPDGPGRQALLQCLRL